MGLIICNDSPPAADGDGKDSGPLTKNVAVTNLYQHNCPRACCPTRWSRYSNHEDEQVGVKDSTSIAPIVHRQINVNKKWMTESFTVQDPTMRVHLQTALADYQDLDLGLEDWTFKPPFSPLVHRWDRLELPAEASDKDKQSEPVQQLMAFLGPLLGPSVEALALTKKTSKVEFDNVWHLYSPGSNAVTTIFGVEAVCRVTKHERFDPPCNPPYWVISLEYIDWNGERCGYTNTNVTITYFEGFRHVVSLPVYPLSFNKSASELKSCMIERGRKFESLRGYNFQSCRGTKILLQTKKPEQRPVTGRVVIDAFAYYRNNDLVKLKLKPLSGVADQGAKDDSSYMVWDNMCEGDESCSDVGEQTDTPQTEGPAMTAAQCLGKGLTRVEILEDLTDEQCLLATPWLRGLDLQTKEWAFFRVDELSPIVWNDAAFDHLVLPGNEKQLSWQFVENKTIANNGFDDFVADKGRGIIILMYGPPGTGKTFTAEAVAERARVPLYSMSAGALGTNPDQVEAALEKALDLCELWNAMLLLDEADVFLTARSTTDLARNELVAIFLTKLEYYPGVCFLTTNRVSTLDHAFQSRVDLFLPYTDLTIAARRQVWDNFVERAGKDKFALTDANLDKLAQIKLNGREIKNLIKSAHLLSLKSADKIGMELVFSLAQNRVQALDAINEQ